MTGVTTINEQIRWEQECLSAITDVIKGTPGEVRIALSGGNTPKNIYKLLGEYLLQLSALRLSQIRIFIVDERNVSFRDKSSNSKMIAERLGGRCFLPFDPILDRPEVYSGLISTHVGEMCDFDLVVLGVGVDGHIASIFPNSKLIHDTTCGFKRNTLSSGEIRYSMTYEMIFRAKKRVIFVGPDERKHVFFAQDYKQTETTPVLPIHYLMRKAKTDVIIHEEV